MRPMICEFRVCEPGWYVSNKRWNMGYSVPLLLSQQALPWWTQKWGLVLHHTVPWVHLCSGRWLISNQALCPVLWWQPILGSAEAHILQQTDVPQDSLLTTLPVQDFLFLPLSARAAGPPELLDLFAHCQCFLLRKYVPIRLCSWGICFLFYLLLFPGPHLLIASSTQWPNNNWGDK